MATIKANEYITNPEVLSPEAKAYFLDIERGVPQRYSKHYSRLGTVIYVGHPIFPPKVTSVAVVAVNCDPNGKK